MASLYLPPTQNSLQYTLDAQLAAGGTSATLNSSVTMVVQAPGIGWIDRVDSSGNKTPTKREYFSFTGVSGAQLTGLVRGLAGSTDQVHSVGAIVEFGPDVVQMQAIYDVITTEHSVAGVHSSALVTSLKATGAVVDTGTSDVTIVTPKAIADSAVTTASKTQTLTNKTLTDSTNNVMAKSLKSATTTIDVSTATAPTAGQVLMATAGTTATWKSSPGEDGWTPVTDTWIYTSANSITVPTGAASKYQKGDRIKWTQTTVKYGVVIAVADTLLTIAITTDYVFTNAAISLPSYSHQAHPLGYPSSFAYTATYTGFSPALTTTGYFSISGNVCVVIVSPATGTSNSTNMTISLPVTSSATSDSNSASRIADASGFQITPGMAAIGASVSAAVLSLNFQGAAASFTATGGKGASLNTSYFI